MGPITQAIVNAVKPNGPLVNEGFEVKCVGTVGPNPRFEEDSAAGFDPPAETLNRHLIATLDDHAPGTQAHAWGNSEFTDDLWVIEPGQEGIDWSNPVCQICSKPIAP